MVWLRYRTLRPEKVQLPGCAHQLVINPYDNRAHNLLVRDIARGKVPNATKLWRKLADHFQPDVVADIGLNYGECLFGTHYPPHARLFGFEANPKVFAYASRSRELHPARDSITLVNALISDRCGPDQELFVDPDWSGTATAIPAIHETGKTIKFLVPVRTVSELIKPSVVQNQKLLFKLDIEGYEPKAMQGFYQAIDQAAKVVGFMEFDTQFLTLGGTDPATFLDELKRRFNKVYYVKDKKALILAKASAIQDIPESKPGSDRRHTDLILIKSASDWRSCIPSDMKVPADE